MEQRDYLKDQIEQFGRVLRKLIEVLSGVDTNISYSDSIQEVETNFKEKIDLDFHDFASDDPYVRSKIIHKFQDKVALVDEMVELLEVYSSNFQSDPGRQYNILSSAIELLDYADNRSKNYSISRKSKAEELKHRLNKISKT